jgi:hypothetical protein
MGTIGWEWLQEEEITLPGRKPKRLGGGQGDTRTILTSYRVVFLITKGPPRWYLSLKDPLMS